MRNVSVLLSILLTSIAATAGLAAKVTSDPNVGSASVSTAAPATTDSRLATKVTYDSGYKRLHNVTDELTASTGVKIYCGSSVKDWQVRDIPLVACVKDLPLGKLLSAITAATHTALASAKLDSGPSKGTVVYRIFRTARAQAQIDGKLDAARQNQVKMAEWSWDAIVSFSRNAGAQKEFAGKERAEPAKVVVLGRLLDSLGSAARSRVMGGESITISGTDSAYRDVIHELYLAHWENLYEVLSRGGRTPEKPSTEAMDSAVLTIHMRDGGQTGFTDIWAEMTNSTGYPFMLGFGGYASHLEGLKSLPLPKRPRGELVADAETDHPADPKLRTIKTAEDWAQPLLSRKVKLARPAGKSYPAFADAISDLAKAGGINIVAEDFISHRWDTRSHFPGAPSGETTPAAILRPAISTWFMDAEDSLIVGWADTSGLWRKRHRNLVSESFLTAMTAKLDKGLELGDVVPVVGLTQAQRDEWIVGNRETTWLLQAFHYDLALWQLYNSLGDADKALARSDDGLPLTKLGPAWVAGFLKARLTEEKAAGFASVKKEPEDGTGGTALLLDDRVVETAVMRVKNVPASTPVILECTQEGLSNHLAFRQIHHSCVIEIEYRKDGQAAVIRSADAALALPVYSWKRELELYKASVAAK